STTRGLKRSWSMHKPHQPDVKTDYLEKLGYETRDVELGSIAGWIAKLFVFIAVTSLLTWGIYWYFLFLARSPSPSSGPPLARRMPPEPNPTVQPNPVLEIRNFRQEEAERLDRAEWKDRNKGAISIPLDRAMNLALERHLFPVRGQANPSPSAPAET